MVRRCVWWVRNTYFLMFLFPLPGWSADGWPLDPAEEEPETEHHDDQTGLARMTVPFRSRMAFMKTASGLVRLLRRSRRPSRWAHVAILYLGTAVLALACAGRAAASRGREGGDAM